VRTIAGMKLVDDLERALAGEESLFRAQLLREDLGRLRKLQELAKSSPDRVAFLKAGARIGWTQGDARTHELREPLDKFLEEVLGYETGDRSAARESRVSAAWHELHRTRMERLLGCLATPVPKPAAG